MVARIGLCVTILALLRTYSDHGPSIKPPLGLPTVPFPPENIPTGVKIALGEKLFFDRRLSANGTISCAMCHVPEQAFTVNELSTAIGIGLSCPLGATESFSRIQRFIVQKSR